MKLVEAGDTCPIRLQCANTQNTIILKNVMLMLFKILYEVLRTCYDYDYYENDTKCFLVFFSELSK